MLSDSTLSKLLRENKIDAVPHGFRSSFRQWAAERTNIPREVAEEALAHVNPNKIEAAYQRSDLFEQRRGPHGPLGAIPEYRECNSGVLGNRNKVKSQGIIVGGPDSNYSYILLF